MTLRLNVRLAKFLQTKTRLPDNQKTMTPRLNVHSVNILRNAKCDTPSSNRGPLADEEEKPKELYQEP